MPKIVDLRSSPTRPASLHTHKPGSRPRAELPRVLIVEQDAMVAQVLEQAIVDRSSVVHVEANLDKACARLGSGTWDILLLGVSTDDGSGLEVLRFLRGIGASTMCILIASALEIESVTSAVHLGIDGLLLKPLNAVRTRDTLDKAFADAKKELQRTAHLARVCSDVETLRQERTSMLGDLKKLQQSVMDALLAALAVREMDSVPHALRVQTYVSYFARAAGYPEALRPHLEHAALLHDVGKIGLSDNLLFRSGVLTQAELDRMRPHTLLGEQILGRINFLRPAAQIVRHHHEWFDGTGHPDGLRGDRIPLGARLFAIIDAMDALTTDRHYRTAQSFEIARREIVRCSGTHFDPQLTARFDQISTGTWSKLRTQVEEHHKKRGLHLAGSRFLS